MPKGVGYKGNKKKDPIKKVNKAASTLGGYSGQAVSAINKRKAEIDRQMKQMGMGK